MYDKQSCKDNSRGSDAKFDMEAPAPGMIHMQLSGLLYMRRVHAVPDLITLGSDDDAKVSSCIKHSRHVVPLRTWSAFWESDLARLYSVAREEVLRALESCTRSLRATVDFDWKSFRKRFAMFLYERSPSRFKDVFDSIAIGRMHAAASSACEQFLDDDDDDDNNEVTNQDAPLDEVMNDDAPPEEEEDEDEPIYLPPPKLPDTRGLPPLIGGSCFAE